MCNRTAVLLIAPARARNGEVTYSMSEYRQNRRRLYCPVNVLTLPLPWASLDLVRQTPFALRRLEGSSAHVASERFAIRVLFPRAQNLRRDAVGAS